MKIREIKELIKKLSNELEIEERQALVNEEKVSNLNYQLAVAENGLRRCKK